ncbi:MAG: acyl-CoA thioesterase [Bacteriovoracia bacterium]
MSLESRIENSRTKVFKTVFPGETNHYDTLFGGTALQWMDEVAFIAATRFTREKMVTVSSDKVNFKMPIPSGSIVELDAQVVRVGNTSLEIKVDVYREDMYSENRVLALHGSFVFVTLKSPKKSDGIGGIC